MDLGIGKFAPKERHLVVANGPVLTQTVGAVWTLALPALLPTLAEGGEFGGYLLLDAALLVQLVCGADEMDGNLRLGR